MAFPRAFRPLALAIFALAANSALAQTLYKLIDRNGRVTYAEEAPKDFDGQVIRIDIDPNRNKATLGVPRPGPSAPPAVAPATAPDPAKRVEDARSKVAAAKKALAEARDHPGQDDVRFIGKVGGGARPVPTEAYQQRLADLERAVKEAEDELSSAQAGR